jgi:hypothetical protein
MSKTGRPSILDHKLQTKICRLLAQGSAIRSACIVCGVSERVFYDWQARGKAGEEPFADFFCAVTRARETHKAKLIQIVLEAAHKDARHAEWLLERQFAAEFARSEPRTMLVERPVPCENNGAAPPVQLVVHVTRDENDPVRRVLSEVVVQEAEDDGPEPAKFSVDNFPRVPPWRPPTTDE